MKTGIVCEGGGMRGVYTSGVLQAFMEKDFVADLLVGVSAGASNGVSYVSNQSGRGYRTNVDYAGDKRYMSFRNFVKTGSIFGMDFLFEDLPERLDPFDYDTFYESHCDFFAGATDINTGKAVYFGKEDIAPGLEAIRASCSMPMLAPIVKYKGGEYLDGGVAAPIPLQKAIDEGCKKLIIILTRERGYRKKAIGFSPLYHAKYHKYPNLVKAMDRRHILYNHILDRINQLEVMGKAIVVAPDVPLEADRMGKDKSKLIASFETGLQDGFAALEKLAKSFGES